ncbi:MAG: hypothetical protein V4689_20870 [Verrucomicrobiota bacterium]
MKILTSLLLAALILPAAGRLGENPEQLVARYGPSTPGKDAAELFFEKNGIAITATQWKGVCHSLRFGPVQAKGRTGFVHPDDVPAPEPPQEAGEPLTREQRMQLLEANSGGSRWFEFKKSAWKTEDSKRNAFLLANGDLCIVTMEFVVHELETHKGGENGGTGEGTERMKGF